MGLGPGAQSQHPLHRSFLAPASGPRLCYSAVWMPLVSVTIPAFQAFPTLAQSHCSRYPYAHATDVCSVWSDSNLSASGVRQKDTDLERMVLGWAFLRWASAGSPQSPGPKT